MAALPHLAGVGTVLPLTNTVFNGTGGFFVVRNTC
jgi:hypothetical protein